MKLKRPVAESATPRRPKTAEVLGMTEQPERAVFDLGRDITETDWAKVPKEILREWNWDLRYYVDGGDAEFPSQLMVLFPHHQNDLHSEENWPRMLERLAEIRQDEPAYFYQLAGQLVILFPDRTDQIITEEDRHRMSEMLRHEPVEKMIWAAAWLVSKEQRQQFKTEQRFQEFLRILNQHRGKGGWNVFASFAVDGSILFPERKQEFLKPDDLKAMKEQLEFYRANMSENWYLFFHLAAAMKLLVADKVALTPQGLKFTFPPRPLSPVRPLPERPQV